MPSALVFQNAPLWAVYAGTLVLVAVAIAGGFRIGSHSRGRAQVDVKTPTGSIVGAMLGLLAFMLAFTFGLASSRYDDRKQLVLDETNAIGTAFLRTDFLPEPQRTASRELMARYVDVRAAVASVVHLEDASRVVRESEALHDQLWTQLSGAMASGGDRVLIGLYAQALNDVIDLHSKRVTVALQYHIPGTIWLMLYFVAALAMLAVGYEFGVAGASSNLVILVLALAFSAVLLLIADLDRATEGVLKVSQQPMLELQQKMRTPVP